MDRKQIINLLTKRYVGRFHKYDILEVVERDEGEFYLVVEFFGETVSERINAMRAVNNKVDEIKTYYGVEIDWTTP